MGFKNILWQGSSLKQDASNRLVTDKEKTIWNNKANNSHTHTKSEVGLGNVDNTADSTKSVKYATSAGSTSNVIDVGVGSADTSRHVWFSNTNPETSRVYSDKFQYNPATDVLTVGSITGSAGSVAWGNVSGRPSSLPASDVYAWAKASTKPSYSWNEIASKPSTFTPSSHTHNYAGSNSAGGAANYVAAGPASVTSEVYRHVWFSDAGTETARCYNDSFKYDPKSNKLTVNISGSANSVPWSGVTGKPSTFPPSSHTHTKSQITDFPTSLKNPNKLSITVDGGDTGATSANTYDGSAAESISVSSSTHNHDLTYLKLTGGTLTGTLYSKLEPYGTSDQYIAHLGGYFSASTTENCYGGSLSIISTLKYTGIRIGYFKSSGQRATLSGGVNFHHNQDKSFGVIISGTTYYSPYIKLTTKLINQNGYYFDADYGFVMRLYNFVPIGNKNTECSIGDSTDKWKFIYATNGTIQTSNELKKNIIKDGIDNRYEELYEKLEPIAFTWNNETADGNTHDRVHLGLGAQTTKKHMDEVGITAEEYALYCEDNIKDEEGNDTGEKEYGINYGQLHALHIHMIQKLLAKVDELETRLMEFENK